MSKSVNKTTRRPTVDIDESHFVGLGNSEQTFSKVYPKFLDKINKGESPIVLEPKVTTHKGSTKYINAKYTFDPQFMHMMTGRIILSRQGLNIRQLPNGNIASCSFSRNMDIDIDSLCKVHPTVKKEVLQSYIDNTVKLCEFLDKLSVEFNKQFSKWKTTDDAQLKAFYDTTQPNQENKELNTGVYNGGYNLRPNLSNGMFVTTKIDKSSGNVTGYHTFGKLSKSGFSPVTINENDEKIPVTPYSIVDCLVRLTFYRSDVGEDRSVRLKLTADRVFFKPGEVEEVTTKKAYYPTYDDVSDDEEEKTEVVKPEKSVKPTVSKKQVLESESEEDNETAEEQVIEPVKNKKNKKH